MDYNEVVRKLRDYATSKASLRKGVKAIVLTGSLAKGNYTGSSDADILIIADNLPNHVLERYSLFAEADLPIDMEPHTYSPEEFLNMVRDRNHFAIETLRVGIPLYGEKYFRELKARLTEY